MRTLFATFLAMVGMALTTPLAVAQIKAVPMPDPQIPGFHFPEKEATILNWINPPIPGDATASLNLNLHGWGIWTALTSETDQVVEGQKIRVFETWYTPEELTAGGVRNLAEAAAKPPGVAAWSISISCGMAPRRRPGPERELLPASRRLRGSRVS